MQEGHNVISVARYTKSTFPSCAGLHDQDASHAGHTADRFIEDLIRAASDEFFTLLLA